MCGGPIANKLSVDKDVINFVGKHVGHVRPTGIASYLRYNLLGSGIKPHIDTEVFSVNLMLMLHHRPPETGGNLSSTIIFPHGIESQKHQLSAGDVMLIHGSSIVHAQTHPAPTCRL